MGKKFVGLGGLKHFWTKAKTWIAGQITAEVTAKIAEIVANAPEDLDTLKEIADWISTHANDASAMNTQINTNKNDIAALQTSVAGKADTGHTHTKSQITDFAHTHDDRYFTETEVTNKLAGKSDVGHKHSAEDITSGVLPVGRGGTGVTTQADINKAFISNLDVGTSDVTDGTEFVSSYASDSGFSSTDEGSLHTPYKRQFIKVWNYIKGKISSVLGLTKDNYGGKASTAGNADTVDNYHASQLWRSDGATWNPNSNVTMTPSGNNDEWSFDFRNKNGATGSYWHVWDENKSTLLRVNADDGKVSAPYGFVGNLSGKADTAGTADSATTAGTATTAAKLGRDGNTGIPMTFNWSGQGGQPSWLWGGNDGSNMYVYNPSNFSVNTANTAYKIRIGNSNPSDGDIWIQ